MSTSASSGRLPDDLRFDLNAAQISERCADIVAALSAAHERVASVPLNAVTWHAVVAPLLDVDNRLAALSASVVLPMHVHTDKLVRDASSAASAALDKHSVELVSRRDVYLRLAALRDARPALDSVQQRLLNKMCEDYERKGVALEPAQAARLKEVNQRLAQLSVDFQSALNEENEQLLFTDDELAGLPADLISTLATAADGRRIVTLKYTHLFPVLKMARKPETRRRVEEANSKKVPENVARMHEALTLKLEAARLLGFESDAAYELSVLMAKTPANVNALLSDLNDRLTPLLEKERQQLLELKSKTEGELADGKLYAHDWRYLQQRVLQAEHNVDEERIKQYFPLEHVATQMFEIFERLFHVKVAKVTPESPNYRVWHPDVEQFVVTDAESGAELGTMFQDLFPREGKYGHACVMPLIPTYVDEANSNARNPVVVVMLANFSKPTKERPSLLDHDEVVTFFHEQGHAYHGLVSRARFARFSGTSVERDFVEAPSQMLENWCWDKKVLKRFSKHVETGEPLPDDLIAAKVRAKTFGNGIHYKRQLFFAMIDQRVHSSEWDASKLDTADLWASMWKTLTHIEPSPGNGMASFGHLMGGYGSRYYGYIYSEVFSADMYSLFEADPFNAALGKRYRDIVLAPGGERDSMDSLVEFLGRPPNNTAFLKSLGLSQ